MQSIYQKAFPYHPEYAEKIAKLLKKSKKGGFEVVLLTAEGPKGRVLGFSFFFYFPDVKYAYLDYIASDPKRHSRGIGEALYEASREFLALKGAKGMIFDVPTDIESKIIDKKLLKTNIKRLAFYERYGARPIINTDYDSISTKANAGYLTFLVFDDLSTGKDLKRKDLKKFVKDLLEVKAGMKAEDTKVKKILASIVDDPVKIREPVYERAADKEVFKGRLKSIDLISVGEKHQIHHLKEKGYVEKPARVNAISKGLADLQIVKHKPKKFKVSHIKEVHDSKLINFLAQSSKKLTPNALLYPDIFPLRRPDRLPKSWEMQTGYYCMDTFTPITSNCYKVAIDAVNCALTGAQLVLNGSRLAYALCRPPGHHAERKAFGGFCYFNNASIAAN